MSRLKARASWSVENWLIADFLSRLPLEFIPSFCLLNEVGSINFNLRGLEVRLVEIRCGYVNISVIGKANK